MTNNEDLLNRRASPRIDARIRVDFRSGREFIACYSENISKGGLFLQTETAPDPNASIEVVLHPPEESGSHEDIKLLGRIVRMISVSDSGKSLHKVALQFIDMTPQVQSKLDLLYEALAQDMTQVDR